MVAGCRIEEVMVATFGFRCGRRGSRTMRISIVGSQSDTGRSSSTEPEYLATKLNGENTVLTARLGYLAAGIGYFFSSSSRRRRLHGPGGNPA